MAIIITDPTTLISGGDTGTSFAAPLSIDTTAKTITITPGSGVLSDTADGVTGQALYSALKLLWKNSSTYIKFPFPMEAITPEQFEFINGWAPANDNTRKALRTCGWVEKNAAGAVLRTYAGIISLGSLQATHQPYYQQNASTEGAVNFKFQGPVNEAISIKITSTITSPTDVNTSTNVLSNSAQHGFVDGDKVLYTAGTTAIGGLTTATNYYIVGSTATSYQVSLTAGGAAIDITSTGSGTHTFVKDSTSYAKLFAREYQYTYSSATLGDIGVSTMTYIVYRFPLANASDSIKVTAQGTGGDYDKILITYYRDTGNNNALYNVRGTYSTASVAYSRSDVVMSANNRWYKCITAYTSNSTQPQSNATNWAAYEGEKTFNGTDYYPYTVVIDADNTVAANASGVNNTTKIYERIQYELRQTYDIDDNANGTIIGKVGNALLSFVGDTLVTAPGVYIESINSNDTNSINFTDATGTVRTYPYTAAGSFDFNANLTSDSSSIYRLFYSNLYNADYGSTSAVLVKDNAGTDISNTVGGQSSIAFSFAYDGNTQTETQWAAARTYAVGDEYKQGTTWYRVHTGYTSGGTFGATDTTNSTALNGTSDGPSVVAIALGLGTGQYVSTNAKLLRATGQKIALTAALERNYTNP